MNEVHLNQDAVSMQTKRDTLTGLMNRRALEAYLQQVLQNRLENALLVASIIDIDNLSSLNDACGHRVGDLYIKEIAALLLCEATAAGGAVARVGGDEFAMVFQPESIEQGLATVRRILRSIKAHEFRNSDQIYRLSASAGISSTLDANDFVALMQGADIACGEAKDTGTSDALVYQPEMLESGYRDKESLRSVLRAYGAGRFKLHVAEVAALVAMPSAVGLYVTALPLDENGAPFDERLVPLIASRLQLNPIADRWLVTEVMGRIRRAEPPFGEQCRIRFELSSQTLMDESLMRDILECISATPIDPSHCTVGMRESYSYRNMSKIRISAGALARLGCVLLPPLSKAVDEIPD